jgi:hypothetical protein
MLPALAGPNAALLTVDITCSVRRPFTSASAMACEGS